MLPYRFCCVLLVCFVFIWGQFPRVSSRGLVFIRRPGRLNGEFFCILSLGGSYLKGLIHGWAYFRNFTVITKVSNPFILPFLWEVHETNNTMVAKLLSPFSNNGKNYFENRILMTLNSFSQIALRVVSSFFSTEYLYKSVKSLIRPVSRINKRNAVFMFTRRRNW